MSLVVHTHHKVYRSTLKHKDVVTSMQLNNNNNTNMIWLHIRALTEHFGCKLSIYFALCTVYAKVVEQFKVNQTGEMKKNKTRQTGQRITTQPTGTLFITYTNYATHVPMNLIHCKKWFYE